MSPPSTVPPGGARDYSGAMAERGGDEVSRALVFVRGRVQNVGFRWWARSRALELGLVGHARNLRDGRVEINAQGPPDAVRALCDQLDPERPPRGRPGHVEAVQVQWHEPQQHTSGFVER